LRAAIGAQLRSPSPSMPKVAPGPGSTSGACSSDSPKRLLPPTEITGLVVPSTAAARPPQPVRVCACVVALSHSTCWSECENRLSGISGEEAGADRYSLLVSGRYSGPTLNTGASAPSFQASASADSAGCRP